MSTSRRFLCKISVDENAVVCKYTGCRAGYARSVEVKCHASIRVKIQFGRVGSVVTHTEEGLSAVMP